MVANREARSVRVIFLTRDESRFKKGMPRIGLTRPVVVSLLSSTGRKSAAAAVGLAKKLIFSFRRHWKVRSMRIPSSKLALK